MPPKRKNIQVTFVFDLVDQDGKKLKKLTILQKAVVKDGYLAVIFLEKVHIRGTIDEMSFDIKKLEIIGGKLYLTTIFTANQYDNDKIGKSLEEDINSGFSKDQSNNMPEGKKWVYLNYLNAENEKVITTKTTPKKSPPKRRSKSPKKEEESEEGAAYFYSYGSDKGTGFYNVSLEVVSDNALSLTGANVSALEKKLRGIIDIMDGNYSLYTLSYAPPYINMTIIGPKTGDMAGFYSLSPLISDINTAYNENPIKDIRVSAIDQNVIDRRLREVAKYAKAAIETEKISQPTKNKIENRISKVEYPDNVGINSISWDGNNLIIEFFNMKSKSPKKSPKKKTSVEKKPKRSVGRPRKK